MGPLTHWSSTHVWRCFVGQHSPHKYFHPPHLHPDPARPGATPGPEPSKLTLGIYLAIGRTHDG